MGQGHSIGLSKQAKHILHCVRGLSFKIKVTVKTRREVIHIIDNRYQAIGIKL